jgi:hypothetical protein
MELLANLTSKSWLQSISINSLGASYDKIGASYMNKIHSYTILCQLSTPMSYLKITLQKYNYCTEVIIRARVILLWLSHHESGPYLIVQFNLSVRVI